MRELRCRRQYHLATALGRELLQVYPNSNIIREEMALSHYWIDSDDVDRKYKGNRLLNEIDESRHGDADLLSRVHFNKKFFMQVLDKHEEARPFKPYDVSLCKLPLVTFSVTTCRRLDLFIRTMTGFLENCLDRHLIHRWICVDDNSSEEDRAAMKEMFPFFEFMWKTPEEKGHPESMQLIAKKVETPFLIHIEDDRMLLDKRHYIKDMIDIFNHDGSIGQVAFNHNYMETVNDDIKGGDLEKIVAGWDGALDRGGRTDPPERDISPELDGVKARQDLGGDDAGLMAPRRALLSGAIAKRFALKFANSFAMSVSRIVDSAAIRFSEAICKLDRLLSRVFFLA